MATPLPLIVHVAPDAATFAARAADLVVREARSASDRGERFSLALAGGSTPAPAYRLLAAPPRRDAIDWSAVDVFFGDERAVPADAEGSNHRMAREALLDAVPIPPENVHRIRGEIPPAKAARAAEAEARAVLGPDLRLSLALLGMGGDGHTASLFPGSPALAETERLFLPAAGPAPWRERVTMTLPLLNRAGVVAFLVAGAEKAERVAEIVAAVRSGAGSPLPAARVRPEAGTLLFLLDAAAAARLPDEAAR